MKRRGKSSFPSKYILLLLTVICIMLLFAGYATGYAGEPIRTICNYVFVPMQKGLDYVGESISINSDDTKTKEQLIAENAQLQEQIDELSTQLTNTRLQQSELDTLRELYDLDQTYADYKTTGAHVIGKGTSNWFNTFTIDKMVQGWDQGRYERHRRKRTGRHRDRCGQELCGSTCYYRRHQQCQRYDLIQQ